MLFKEFHDDIMVPLWEESLREVTIAGYESKWKNHISKAFAETDIKDIDAYKIQSFLGRIKSIPLRRSIWTVLRLMINKAYAFGFIDDNPTLKVRVKKQPIRLDANILNAKQIKKLIDGFYGHKLEPWLIASASTGLRREEGCGLEWEDIDLETGKTKIERGLQNVNGKLIVVEPKTELSRRFVYIPKGLTARLKESKEDKNGRLIGDMTPDQVARQYKQYCFKNNLPWCPPKNLRHSYATSALEAGVDVAIVSRALGHADISTTMKYYLRPNYKDIQKAANIFEQSLISS